MLTEIEGGGRIKCGAVYRFTLLHLSYREVPKSEPGVFLLLYFASIHFHTDWRRRRRRRRPRHWTTETEELDGVKKAEQVRVAERREGFGFLFLFYLLLWKLPLLEF